MEKSVLRRIGSEIRTASVCYIEFFYNSFLIHFLKKKFYVLYYAEYISHTVGGVFDFGVGNGKQYKFFRKSIR